MESKNTDNDGRALWQYIVLAAIIFFQGCAPAKLAPLEDLKELPKAPADAALIYFMRPASTVGGTAWPAILIDGKKRGILPSAAFTVITLAPGDHTILLENEQGYMDGWPPAVHVRVQAGERYFMKLEVISEIIKGIAIAPIVGAGGAILPMILPAQQYTIRSMRWIVLPESEGIKEAEFLMYSPREKSGY